MTAPFIRAIEDRDIEAVVQLWHDCGLTRPYNDPYKDISLCRSSGHGEILVLEEAGAIVATAMVGHDGHRGWVYYLAVSQDRQSGGVGRMIMTSVEVWLAERGVAKLMLMIRTDNLAVRDFYLRLGYEIEERAILSKWLEEPASDTAPMVHSTIIHLAMDAPPTSPTPHPPAGLKTSLIRAVQPTVSFYRWLYDTVGAGWTWTDRRAMSDSDLHAAIISNSTEIYVVYVDGVPAGFGEVVRYKDINEAELMYFGLVPEYIGRGLGTYFIRAMIDIAWSGEPKRITVHTCDLDHPRALANYQRAGFVAISREVELVPDPRRVGLPMPPAPEDRDYPSVVHLPVRGE